MPAILFKDLEQSIYSTDRLDHHHVSFSHRHPRLTTRPVSRRCPWYVPGSIINKVVILGGFVPEAKIHNIPDALNRSLSPYMSPPDAVHFANFAV